MDTWPAPAKLNLFLHVIGRREDGFHELQTIFQFLDYGDELRFRIRNDGLIRRVGLNDGLPVEDLSVQAARCLQEATGTGAGVDIEVVKKVPIGSGLGGGSSDAATTLLALNHLWRLELDVEKLNNLGLSIGADVPAFISGRSAYAEGAGEHLLPLDLPTRWYCVLVPPVCVLTAHIFNDPELTRDTPRRTIPGLLTGKVRNDLEPVTCRQYPIVGRCLQWLRGFGEARMTGSGAALFVEVPDRAGGLKILAEAPPGCGGFVARGVNRHPLAMQPIVGV
jgi:4-diphosphocytidyl-2-C-methyl-D-erythritol kinase